MVRCPNQTINLHQTVIYGWVHPKVSARQDAAVPALLILIACHRRAIPAMQRHICKASPSSEDAAVRTKALEVGKRLKAKYTSSTESSSASRAPPAASDGSYRTRGGNDRPRHQKPGGRSQRGRRPGKDDWWLSDMGGKEPEPREGGRGRQRLFPDINEPSDEGFTDPADRENDWDFERQPSASRQYNNREYEDRPGPSGRRGYSDRLHSRGAPAPRDGRINGRGSSRNYDDRQPFQRSGFESRGPGSRDFFADDNEARPSRQQGRSGPTTDRYGGRSDRGSSRGASSRQPAWEVYEPEGSKPAPRAQREGAAEDRAARKPRGRRLFWSAECDFSTMMHLLKSMAACYSVTPRQRFRSGSVHDCSKLVAPLPYRWQCVKFNILSPYQKY